MDRVDIKAILADPEQRAALLSNVFDPGRDGTHIPSQEEWPCSCGHAKKAHSQAQMCLFGGCHCKRFMGR